MLQPQDLLRVQVFQEPDLDREVRVSQEQTIFLPLIGAVELKGTTIREAGERIRALYDRDYLVNPQVNVIVVEYSKRFVKVFGSVGSPGVVEFPAEQGLTLLEAIARAGSFTRLADSKKVVLNRTMPDGRTESIPINADDLTKRGEGEDVPLRPDDVIYVGERIL